MTGRTTLIAPPSVPADLLAAEVTRGPSATPPWLTSGTRPRPRLRRRLRAVVLAAALAGGVGLLLGSAMPRGPLTAGGVLLAMTSGAVTGLGAGRLLGSRWALLVAPSAFGLAYELGRLGTEGATVDSLRSSTYGFLALAVGRGVVLLVVVFPMVTGILAGLATREPTRTATQALAGLGCLLVGVLAAAFAWPASTPPITDADGLPRADSVAELTSVEVDGRDLGLLIRGQDVDNPVLLFLAGVPGGSELGAMRRPLEALETTFTVVTWDQRGAGRSYPALDPVDELTVDRMLADTIAVTEYLRQRFGQERIVLVGQSWGSLLGVLVAAEHPELYAAYVGVGQMVRMTETDRLASRDTVAWAQRQSEYTLLDRLHAVAGVLDSFSVLYRQLEELDLREQVTELELPVHLVQGQHEIRGRTVLAEEWFATLTAPHKLLETFPTSGHRPMIEQPDRFVAHMNGEVLPHLTGGLS